MKKRSRTVRRERDRADEKLARDLEKLSLLSPGGAPDRAIDIASPSEVEVRARATPCPICQGELRVIEHTAETIAGTRLRIARCECAGCGRRRAIHFRLPGATLN